MEKEPIAAIAQTLRRMRLSRDWTCEELAEKAGVPPETIQGYETRPLSLSEKTALRVFEAIPLHPRDREIFRDTFLITPPNEVIQLMQTSLYELEAAVCIDERSFREALDKLDFTLVLRPPPDRAGRIQLSRATVLAEMGWDDKALAALHEAERCFHRSKEPHLWLRLRLEQLYLLCRKGQYREAETRLAETKKLAARAGRDRERLQVRRLTGWIASGLGRTEEALHILQPVCEEMVAAGLLFESGCVAFDVAALLMAEGKAAEVAELADQMEPLTREKKLSHDARTTLKVFSFTVRRGTFTAEMARQLGEELRKAGSRLTRPYELPK